MSHVDEGTLHSYFDGELPSSERAAVEAHLAQCATCRATLGEERALLERASALLGSARPLERPAPPFEHLRRPQRSLWRVRTPVAWAASIILALGLGYYLGDPGSDASLVSTPPAVAVAEDRAAAPTTRPPAMERARREPRSRRLDTVTRQVARADEPAGGDPAAGGVVALKSSSELRDVAPAFKNSLVLGEGDLVTTQWPIISRGAAASLLGTDPVGLPGVATRRIRRSPASDATVVVEQALDSSTVIRVFQRPAVMPGYSAGERAQAARQIAPADRLARFVGRLRVEISGPLTPDSLNRLLEQVEPLP